MNQAAHTSRRTTWAIISLIFVTGIALRLIGISDPPFDSHSTRQCQTLSTIEDFHRNGINLAYPRTLYMGYPGTFVLELPLFQATAALLYKAFGPHLELIRLLNILIGIATTWLLYRTTELCLDRSTAIVAASIYWLAPVNIVYQRSTLIDPSAVCLGLAAAYSVLMLTWTPSAENPPSPRGRWWIALLVTGLMTSLIKALYLWPAVFVFARAILERRFKPNQVLLGIFSVFALSGLCFLAWNRHANAANSASPLAGAISPSSLLGFSALADPSFYVHQLIWRPRWWVGVVGVLAYPFAWIAAAKIRETAKRSVAWCFLLIPPTYLLLFANINHPHDYYQLIITPFLAVAAALGLQWLRHSTTRVQIKANSVALLGLGAAFVVFSVWTYAFWMKAPRTSADLLAFQRLCEGRLERWRPGTVLVSRSVAGPYHGAFIPDYIYAAGVWGCGQIVGSEEEATSRFAKFYASLPQLEYVIVYGFKRPDWLPANFELRAESSHGPLWIFQRTTRFNPRGG